MMVLGDHIYCLLGDDFLRAQPRKIEFVYGIYIEIMDQGMILEIVASLRELETSNFEKDRIIKECMGRIEQLAGEVFQLRSRLAETEDKLKQYDTTKQSLVVPNNANDPSINEASAPLANEPPINNANGIQIVITKPPQWAHFSRVFCLFPSNMVSIRDLFSYYKERKKRDPSLPYYKTQRDFVIDIGKYVNNEDNRGPMYKGGFFINLGFAN